LSIKNSLSWRGVRRAVAGTHLEAGDREFEGGSIDLVEEVGGQPRRNVVFLRTRHE